MKLIVRYYVDKVLPNTTANSFARIEMARGFAQLPNVAGVDFYYLADSKADIGLAQELKVKLKPLFIPFLSKVENSNNKLAKICKFFANRYVNIYFFFHFLFNPGRNDELIFLRSRDQLPACYLASLLRGFSYAAEVQDYRGGKSKIVDSLYLKFMRRAKFVVDLSHQSKINLTAFGLEPENIHIAMTGVNLARMQSVNKKKADLRKQLKMDLRKFCAVYVGSLGEKRGIEEIVGTAKALPEIDIHMIGGTSDEIASWVKLLNSPKNVIWHGQKPYSAVPEYLYAADALLAPYSNKHQNALVFSPVKLYEYMATGIPAIVTDNKAIRDSVSEEHVYFCKSDDAKSLIAAIKQIRDNPAAAAKRAAAAKVKVNEFTWSQRATDIINKYLAK